MKILIGYTGFVGSNLNATANFDFKFNSKNIQDAYGLNPDICVYAGVRAEKYLANANETEDFQFIQSTKEIIQKISPKKLILISTIDVYGQMGTHDEDYPIDKTGMQPYGKNRLILEEWVEANIKDYLIVRLPGLYGNNLKKNFIYDYLQFIPFMLKVSKYQQLNMDGRLEPYYRFLENGFYQCINLDSKERNILKQIFMDKEFSALSFTDSRISFQFYNLKFLWSHIEVAMKNNIHKINLVTEPMFASELYQHLSHQIFKNEILEFVPHYDFRTKYDTLFEGIHGYIFDKDFVLKDIKTFVENTQ